jgi:ribosomal protein S6--L-glutamate ligase
VKKLRVGVAGVPGAWSTEQMAQALRNAGVEAVVFSLRDCLHRLDTGQITVQGFDLSQLDGIVVKKLTNQLDASARLRLHLLRQLEAAGVRIYSRPSVIEQVMDRYRMSMRLTEAGLPVPPTYSYETTADLREAVHHLGSAVVKPVYTSKGRGMERIDEAAVEVRPPDRDGEGRALVQQFIDAPGRDIGACVLGGEFVKAFYRVARDGEWMTTTAAGGSYRPCALSKDGVFFAQHAAQVFQLDYTIVDLVETPKGYHIYEVSAFGGFRGLWEAYGHDVAKDYARFVKWDLRS